MDRPPSHHCRCDCGSGGSHDGFQQPHEQYDPTKPDGKHSGDQTERARGNTPGC